MKTLVIVGIAIFLIAISSVANPPSDFAIDARPRTMTNYVDVHIYNANSAEGGIAICNIVDVSGRIVERLADKVHPIAGEQIITVNTSSWGVGMYFLFVSDHGNRTGYIKLLKTG